MPPKIRDFDIPLEEGIKEVYEAFIKCREKAEDPGETDFASLFLHCAMIHMARGIDCLVSHNCFIPTRSLARSMLESWFYLKYIHERDYERRSLSWLCAYYHDQIKIKDLADPTSDAGKKLQETLKKEMIGWQVPTYQPSDIEKFKKNRNDLLNELKRPKMRPIEKEFQRLKDKWRRVPKWYEMFNKRMKLRALAEHVRLDGFYALLYGPWSGTTHNTDAASLVTEKEDGSLDFKKLDDTTGFEKIETGVRIFLSEGTAIMASHFVKQKN
jgi:hypothetical protein